MEISKTEIAAFLVLSPIVGVLFTHLLDGGEQTITIHVPNAQVELLKQGRGDPAQLYGAFAKVVDPIITAGGQGADIEVQSGGKLTHLQNLPKPAVAP